MPQIIWPSFSESYTYCCCPCTYGRGNDRDDGHSNAGEETDEEPKKYIPHNSVKLQTNYVPQTASSPGDCLGIYKALWPFEARAQEEISFAENDLFRVTERAGDWWKAEKLADGVVVGSGVVPYNYLVKVETLDAQP